MRLSSILKTDSETNKDTIHVVLDQTRIYMEESLGSVMIRGEVIVNFSKDIPIQGPIELLFEGIQRFYPWPEIMAGSLLGSPIETKFQVIELSLLPPNSKGIMPSGIHRFPFEFPIPTSLPMTLYIKDRLEIFYRLQATLRRSVNDMTSWMDRSRYVRKKYVAQESIQIVGSVGSVGMQRPAVISNPRFSHETNSNNSNSIDTVPELPWDHRSLDSYQNTFDNQHDLLASSLSGVSIGNHSQTFQELAPVEGIQYKLGIDRTAIALGTSVGIEVMIKPTIKDAVIKTIILKIMEKRRYSMKVPAGHTWGLKTPKTNHHVEKRTVILKWACGHPAHGSDDLRHTKDMFVYDCINQHDSYFNLSSQSDGLLDSKSSRRANLIHDNISEIQLDDNKCISSNNNEFINLKELDQQICIGEYFHGNFVMPVPDCTNILRPSMKYESVHITHWLQLIVTIRSNDRIFDLKLESPAHVLDCRLVNDDDHQTLIPSPPAYDPKNTKEYNEKCTFWEQRNPITLMSTWGSCIPCPCEAKKLKKRQSKEEALDQNETDMKHYSLQFPEPPPYSEK